MGHHHNGTLTDRRSGLGVSAAVDLPARRGLKVDIAAVPAGVRSALGLLAEGLAWHRLKAEALRDLSAVDDYVLRDIGLNRSLIDRSRYRITRPGTGGSGIQS